MRTLRIVGLVTLLGWCAGAVGCDSDDDDAASSASTGGAAGARGGSAGDAGGANAGDANAGDPGDAGDAGAVGESSVVPYANVVAVSVASGSDGAYTFGVSIESADIDCTQFANWWEVLTEDGALVYRRILEHSHTDANGSSDADQPGNTFTRTGGPVPVAADAVVIVRAHVSTGGYKGWVMRGSAAQGFAQATDIDEDFAVSVEGDAPQPTGCDF